MNDQLSIFDEVVVQELTKLNASKSSRAGGQPPPVPSSVSKKKLKEIRLAIGRMLDQCRACEFGKTRHTTIKPEACLRCPVLAQLEEMGRQMVLLTCQTRREKKKTG